MKNKVILLVEDDPGDARLTLRAFRKSNIAGELVVSTDGAQALDYLFKTCMEKGGVLPALVLLDLKLPKVDGLEVLRRIRAHHRLKCLPVVVLTSSREDRDICQSYDFGANSYIRKPVDFDQFVVAAHQLGLYWLLLNQMPPVLEESL